MKIPENLIDYIRAESEKIDFGSIIIEFCATSNKIDIISQKRQRFEKDNYHKG